VKILNIFVLNSAFTLSSINHVVLKGHNFNFSVFVNELVYDLIAISSCSNIDTLDLLGVAVLQEIFLLKVGHWILCLL